MLESIKYNWSFLRVVRLIMGFIVIGQSFVIKDVLFGVAGLIFVIMALFNKGCCGVGTCNTVAQKENHNKETTYEEVG
ncbi:MAG: hypothetical protein RIR96_259 [Bacteroidota bacterium]|jgi:hypothetical protein